MRPIILSGHSRPMRAIKFNKDGDLLFTGSDDRYVSMWAAESGERIGTFHHTAAVNALTITHDSKILITGDKTGSCYFWEVNTGKLLKKIETEASFAIRSVDLSYVDDYLCFGFGGRGKDAKSGIKIYSVDDILKANTNAENIVENLNAKIDISPEKGIKFSLCKFIDLGKNIVFTSEEGYIGLIDVSTGKIIKTNKIHSKEIMDMDISNKEEIIMTASKDGKSHIIDPETLDIIQTIFPEDPVRNLNACKISPLFDISDENEAKFHGIVGGGQDARDVTNTDSRKGGFEMIIYNIMYGTELGSVLSHFGPINALGFSPSGKVIVTGGEDSSVRIWKLDDEYMNLN